MEIIQHPDNTLLKVSEPVNKVDTEIIKEMAKYKNKCLGLAAIQLGFPVRVIMVKLGTMYVFMVNPEIIKQSEKTSVYPEGCMSIAHGKRYFDIVRPKRVKVRYLDLSMKPRTVKGDLLTSHLLQHEIDHLDGKLIIYKKED